MSTWGNGDEAALRKLVEEVVRARRDERRPEGALLGVHADVSQAMDAAALAQRALQALKLDKRREILAHIRRSAAASVRWMAEDAVRETGMGRVDDKIAKNLLAIHKTPGLEALESRSFTGDHGLMLEERAPFGVIAAVTPSTNPTETILNNGLGMIAGGNAVVFSPHPGAAQVSQRCIDLINRASRAAGGPDDLVTCVANPSIASAQAAMSHPVARLVVVTGGGAVVQAAMRVGKRCIAGGPGNPPVVVDATADLRQAAVGLVQGASFDNNVICTDEKEVFAVDAVFDALLAEVVAAGAVRLSSSETERLAKLLFPGGQLDRRWVGRSAARFLEAIDRPAGANSAAGADPRLLVCEVDGGHPFVQHELLMPILPFVRVSTVDLAIDLAIAAEHGYRHTAGMYSKNLDVLHEMARRFDGSIFVKNAPHYAGLGFGGEGPTSFTIASPTGEGLTTARDFTRVRRCTLAGYFRIT